MGFQKYFLFLGAPKEPNYQFECLLSTANEIGQRNTSLVTRKKLLELGWEVMPHPPYSPDLAPSDYHLFRSFQNHLNGKIFD